MSIRSGGNNARIFDGGGTFRGALRATTARRAKEAEVVAAVFVLALVLPLVVLLPGLVEAVDLGLDDPGLVPRIDFSNSSQASFFGIVDYMCSTREPGGDARSWYVISRCRVD